MSSDPELEELLGRVADNCVEALEERFGRDRAGDVCEVLVSALEEIVNYLRKGRRV
ncbi:MAG: hypothetical protein LM564_00180 [Desulfurococcaceae archaeon]|nr:hypothetical protein [Desulfurococcaceae archaeon]